MSEGPSTDRDNEPVVDPTMNVLRDIAHAVKRLDDLRFQSEKYLAKIVQMEAEHGKELRILEAARINAIRAVDVAASQQATKDAEIRATALAKQVSDAAEAMRVQVSQTAAAAATALAAALAPIQTQLAELTQRMYEQQGQKAQVIESRATDADFAPILEAIKRLEGIASENAGGRAQVVEARAVSAEMRALIVLVLAVLAFLGYKAAARPVIVVPNPTPITTPITTTTTAP
jgi:seryl-tRNA synthetase